MKNDEPPDPGDIGLFGAPAVVAEANGLANPIEELDGWGIWLGHTARALSGSAHRLDLGVERDKAFGNQTNIITETLSNDVEIVAGGCAFFLDLSA